MLIPTLHVRTSVRLHGCASVRVLSEHQLLSTIVDHLTNHLTSNTRLTVSQTLNFEATLGRARSENQYNSCLPAVVWSTFVALYFQVCDCSYLCGCER